MDYGVVVQRSWGEIYVANYPRPGLEPATFGLQDMCSSPSETWTGLSLFSLSFSPLLSTSTFFQKLQSEIEMLESSLETAHATIKALQSQLPEGTDQSSMIKQVQLPR